uniref:C-24(28) sterol reductase n=1 Tax=Ganoderma boninense TaxID=34458 RepID=A0A5K1JUI8_9APHY|nr:C-24(28) sterol reductase [Ganoderma boninense]
MAPSHAPKLVHNFALGVSIKMWLLSTDRAELHCFASPEDVPGGYAILSHVWDKEEQTSKTSKGSARMTSARNPNPRDFASAKIRESCILAERHGYKWIWNDTCCIDKRSSSELSEAINSMYRYYSLAEVCYAYLRDVPNKESENWELAFHESLWHKRGWTLQELIAPDFLLFLSTDWNVLGTKTDLADKLEVITMVPATVLRKEVELSGLSVAQRMSWAAGRETTRVEDEAYCLMGIFSINISTLYGESRHAFFRLQEEIMKKLVDTSLVAWGFSTRSLDVNGGGSALDQEDSNYYVLADSPHAFHTSNAVSFSPPRAAITSHKRNSISSDPMVAAKSKTALSPQGAIPTFSITPFGINAHVQTFKVNPRTLIAILLCSVKEGRRQYPLGLVLTLCADSPDPSRPLYHTGCRDKTSIHILRLVRLPQNLDDLRIRDKPISLKWRNLYITHRPPRQAFQALSRAKWTLESVSKMPPVWRGSTPMAFTFRDCYGGFLVLAFGRCTAGEELGAHWATVRPYGDAPPAGEIGVHECAEDHIGDWRDRRKTFEASYFSFQSALTLAFSPCPINPADTLVVDMHYHKGRDLEGQGE